MGVTLEAVSMNAERQWCVHLLSFYDVSLNYPSKLPPPPFPPQLYQGKCTYCSEEEKLADGRTRRNLFNIFPSSTQAYLHQKNIGPALLEGNLINNALPGSFKLCAIRNVTTPVSLVAHRSVRGHITFPVHPGPRTL